MADSININKQIQRKTKFKTCGCDVIPSEVVARWCVCRSSENSCSSLLLMIRSKYLMRKQNDTMTSKRAARTSSPRHATALTWPSWTTKTQQSNQLISFKLHSTCTCTICMVQEMNFHSPYADVTRQQSCYADSLHFLEDGIDGQLLTPLVFEQRRQHSRPRLAWQHTVHRQWTHPTGQCQWALMYYRQDVTLTVTRTLRCHCALMQVLNADCRSWCCEGRLE